MTTRTHYRACNLCEAICGLEIEVEGDQIRSIRGDSQDPFSEGHICPKGVALQDIHNDPDRLREPQLRTADGWRSIGWDEALERAATGIRQVQDRYGRHAVATYHGNPTVHSYGALLASRPFLHTLGSRNNYTASSVDQLPHHVAARTMFGHQLLLPIPDLDHTRYLLVLGANPLVSNGSLMTAPNIKRRLKALRQRGGQLVVVDPRRTETAKLADRHLFIRPGTDGLLLASMIRTLFEEGLAAPGRLADFTDGLDELPSLLDPFTPEAVAPRTGIEAAEIHRLAREFAAADGAVCHGRLGVSVQSFGALCQWLINVLHVVTGNLDRPGGALFTSPAADVLKLAGRGGRDRWRSRVRGLPEFGGELPSAALAEEILTPGEDQVRCLVTAAGNPVLSTPNGRQLERALGELEFMVSIDFYVNETTRHAHLILPPTDPLSRDNYDLIFHLLAVRNTSRYSPALFERPAEARHDWQIYEELERRLDRRPTMRRRLERWLWRRFGPRWQLALLLRLGPRGPGLNPFRRGLTLKRLEAARHGLDLGPLEPRLPRRLWTPEKRIQLLPEPYQPEVERLRGLLGESSGNGELLLIGRRHLQSNNSWMHNSERLMRGKDRCTLLVHPQDASRLGLAEDGPVRVSSRVGEVTAPVEVSDEVMPGVVSLPHGWGHDRDGVQLATARRSPGISVNDLTDDQRVDPLCGNAAVNGVPVRVEPLVSG